MHKKDKMPDNLINILSKCYNYRFVDYNGKVLRFGYAPENKNDLQEQFNEFKISADFFHNDECEIELNKKYNHDTVLFLNEKEFLNRMGIFKNDFHELNLAIIDYEGHFLIKYKEESFSESKALFFNTIHYWDIIDFIAQSTDFISLHDELERRFIIFSGEKGPFFIGYNPNEAKTKSLPDLEKPFANLKNAFSKIDFIQFFKEAVIQGIHSTQEEGRFFELIKSLQVLVEIATRDHNFYLKQFGFDKIKAKFKEERVKYFDSIEKNIESISKQVTSFPLTFAASIFAGYQVKEKSFILFIILGAYFLYTVIAWKILDVVAFNRLKIKEDVDLERTNIQTSYQVLYDDFAQDFFKIEEKISKLKTLINLLRIVLTGLLIGFTIFCIYQYRRS
jgi:hypothetical protein